MRQVGASYPVEELAEELLRDRSFYKHSNGGVTLSGGECSLYPDYVEALLKRLKSSGIHIVLETSGFFVYEIFCRQILPYMDLIYYDLKIADCKPYSKREETSMAKEILIHLSDLHIGLRKEESKRTQMIFDKIANSFPGIPVIITGDLTDSASEKQFKETRKLLDPLAQTNPILAVPGNHDYAWKGNLLRDDGWINWVKYLGSPIGWGKNEVPWMEMGHEPVGIDGLGVWTNESYAYFGIDSGDPKDKQITARGYISEKLAGALQESLNKYANKTRIAILHHHPFTEGFFTKLKGSELLLVALKDRCELLLFGHEHEYGVWWGKRGVPLIVSSHKSTDSMSGDCLVITVIEIENPGTPTVSFRHRLEVV